MLKNKIAEIGLHKAPENLEIQILLHASQKLNREEETDVFEYISWLPFVGILLLLKDFITGEKLRIKPIIEI